MVMCVCVGGGGGEGVKIRGSAIDCPVLHIYITSHLSFEYRGIYYTNTTSNQSTDMYWPHTKAFYDKGAGCSSVDSVPAFEAVGRRIDPSQWTQLHFGLFSVPTSGPQLVYQRPWYVLFCLWKCAYKRSLAAYRKE